MPDQTSAPEPFTAGPASSYPPVIAELTAERDRLAAELDEQLDLGAELLARLMAVSAIAERWTSRPGTPEHDCGIDIREALKGVTAPVPGSSHRAQEPAERPRIVCLCGSTRFKAQFEFVNRHLTLDGSIVLAPGVFGHTDGPVNAAEKHNLDQLHLAKIRLADEVYVVSDSTGYYGESTKGEIAYAEKLGKPVRYWAGESQASEPAAVELERLRNLYRIASAWRTTIEVGAPWDADAATLSLMAAVDALAVPEHAEPAAPGPVRGPVDGTPRETTTGADPYTASAWLCDDDGIVRKGAMHHGTDYPCTGSAHYAGEHIRCNNPVHDRDGGRRG